MDIPSKNKLRDVARLAIQSAVAAAAMFSLMRALGLPEVFVGVLSAALIVQPSLGSTLGSGVKRILATVVGCGIGVLTIWVIPYGYGTAAALAISMLVMNAIAGFRPEWKYGVVAAVALSLSAESDIVQAAIDRSLSIGIGAAIGIVTSLVVWPERATTRARRKLADAARYLAEVLRDLADARSEVDRSWRNGYREVLSEVNSLIANVRIDDNDPIEARRDAVERLHDAVLILHRTLDRSVGDGPDPRESDLFGKLHRCADDAIEALAAAAQGDADSERPLDELASKLRTACDTWSEACISEHTNGCELQLALSELCEAVDALHETFAATSRS